MAVLVGEEEFRAWAGANVPATVPGSLVAACLEEAEAALVADVGCSTVNDITSHPDAARIAYGDMLRRTSNLLARRNSPEGIAGVGDDGMITVPSGDPGSPAAVRRIRRYLGIPVVVVA